MIQHKNLLIHNINRVESYPQDYDLKAAIKFFSWFCEDLSNTTKFKPCYYCRKIYFKKLYFTVFLICCGSEDSTEAGRLLAFFFLTNINSQHLQGIRFIIFIFLSPLLTASNPDTLDLQHFGLTESAKKCGFTNLDPRSKKLTITAKKNFSLDTNFSKKK